MSRLRIVVTGLIGQHLLGGVTWDYLQYVLGLRRLGHDVFYLEDTGAWPYNANGTGGDWVVRDCASNVRHLRAVMRRFDLADRWMFRCAVGPSWAGLSERRRHEVLETADLLLNVSGSLAYPKRYRSIPRLAYVDSDPVFTQVRIAAGERRLRERVDLHDVHFSFGERLASAPVPDTGHRWLPTRQPIVLAEWRTRAPTRATFTTVMNWAGDKLVSFEGRTYGQKNVELARFLDVPALVAPTELELALRRVRRRRRSVAPIARLERSGFRVVDPIRACSGLDRYRDYVQGSKGEWSVAKNGYVVGRAGWFSCRSACYLAAGRPVVVQDTGFGDVLPTGEGILSFRSPADAAEAVRAVVGDYRRHRKAARAIAEEYFASDRVLARLVAEAAG